MIKTNKNINWYRVKMYDLFADNVYLAFHTWDDAIAYLSSTIGLRADIIPEFSGLSTYLESDNVVRSIRGYRDTVYAHGYYIFEEKQN